MLVDKETIVKICLDESDIAVLNKAKSILKEIKEKIGEEVPEKIVVGNCYSNDGSATLEVFEGVLHLAYQLDDYMYTREGDR